MFLVSDAIIYYCIWHRNEAWKRWLRSHSNFRAPSELKEQLKLLKRIGNSRDEVDYLEAEYIFKNSDYYIGEENTRMQNYYSTWVKEKEVC